MSVKSLLNQLLKVSRFKNRVLCLLWFMKIWNNRFQIAFDTLRHLYIFRSIAINFSCFKIFSPLQKTEKLVALFHVQIKIGQGCFGICKFLCSFVKKMGAGLPIGRNWPTSFIWRIHRNEWDLWSKSLKIIDKGQIKSEWIYEGIDFPN